MTVGFVVAAAGLLFLRIAGREWKYDLRAYRRSLVLAAGLTMAALASAWFWPDLLGGFWETQSYEADGQPFVQRNRPGLGWYAALVAALLLWFAWAPSRRPQGPQTPR